jgi:hypothetical protein
MESPIEQKLVHTLGTLLSLAEMELLIDILDNHHEEFYEGVCIEYSRLYPEDAKEMFGEPFTPKEDRR